MKSIAQRAGIGVVLVPANPGGRGPLGLVRAVGVAAPAEKRGPSGRAQRHHCSVRVALAAVPAAVNPRRLGSHRSRARRHDGQRPGLSRGRPCRPRDQGQSQDQQKDGSRRHGRHSRPRYARFAPSRPGQAWRSQRRPPPSATPGRCRPAMTLQMTKNKPFRDQARSVPASVGGPADERRSGARAAWASPGTVKILPGWSISTCDENTDDCGVRPEDRHRLTPASTGSCAGHDM